MNPLLEKAHLLSSQGRPFVIATLVEIIGGAPQECGAKMIIEKSNTLHGTIGGGKLEAKTIKEAHSLLESKEIKRFSMKTWNLQSDVGMTCGGKVSITFETYGASNWNIALFGAGHVAQALTRVLVSLDCSVTCIDPRSEWTSQFPKSPKLNVLCISEPQSIVHQLSRDTFYVVMTQGHGTDLPVLTEIFRHRADAPFIGCMGSTVKAIRLRKDLIEAGISQELVEKLKTPIGLPIGSNTPEEIAISVAAQLLEERSRFTLASAAPITG